MALTGTSPIGYFGPNSGGIVRPQRPVDVPPSQYPPQMQADAAAAEQAALAQQAGLPVPTAAPPGYTGGPGGAIQHARQNPIVSALIAAAAGLHQHESRSSMQAHAARNAFGQEMAGALGLSNALEGGGAQPSLAHMLAAAAAAHPQMGGIGGTLKRLRPGGGSQLPPQANQYPQLHAGMG